MINIIQWNINGYTNNYNQLLILIKKYSPKIITLQETHIHSTNNIPVPINYSLYNTNKSQNTHGGAAILIHNSIQHQQILLNGDLDATAVQLQSTIKFTTISIYIPPHFTFNTINLEQTISSINTPSIITGDFNSWHQTWGSNKNNKKGQILNDFINANELTLLNDGSPTHLSTHNTFTHVDLTFCSPRLTTHTEWSVLDDLYCSDHYPIKTTIFKQNTPTEMKIKPKFITKNLNWEKYQQKINDTQKNHPISTNINKENATIIKTILEAANETIPQSHKQNRKKTVPWWNETLKILKSQKKEALKQFKRNMTTENLINYKKTNAKFRKEIKIEKATAISKFTAEIKPSTPIEKIWRNIRTFTGYKTTHKIHCISKINNHSTIITDQKEIAEEFATHWSKQSEDTNFHQKFQSEKSKVTETINQYFQNNTSDTLNEKITEIELNQALETLTGKTPGFDRINYGMLKNLPQEMKNRILQLFNLIFNNYLPQTYKNSTVIPILKQNKDKSQTNSYHPISLNSCLSKVLDKIIANRLWQFISDNKLLHSHQLGFRKGKSVADTLIIIDHLITNSLQKKQHLSILALDFEKAFDKIGKHTIINQLIEWKMGQNIINYLNNYLTNRNIKVHVSNAQSTLHPLANGIPQGSPLSAILFLIAYNKLCNILTKHKEIEFYAYADDFYLIFKHNKQKNPTININTILNEIKQWSQHSGAKLSTNKCKLIHFCRKQKCKANPENPNTDIETTHNLKILGLIFNNKYKWNNHIEQLNTELTKKLNIIKCLANNKMETDPIAIISVIKAIIISKINYGLYLYQQAAKTKLNTIKRTLNTAMRSALGAKKSTPTINLYYEADIDTIENLIEKSTAKISKNLIRITDPETKKIIKNTKNRKKTNKITSAIERCINKCVKLNIPYEAPTNTHKITKEKQINKTAIDVSLNKYKKDSTPNDVYKTLFNELKDKYNKYKMIFTDASKRNEIITYAITQDNTTIKVARLEEYSSIYSAEIISINETIKKFEKKKGKYIICTDSLSAIQAISNPKNSEYYANNIRKKIIKLEPKFKILWLPGHAGIPGNELADTIAKEALLSPLLTTPNYNTNDITRYINKTFNTKTQNIWEQTSDWYKQINKNQLSIRDWSPKLGSISRFEKTKITRLRLGHTSITHTYANGRPPTVCKFCTEFTEKYLEHLINDCRIFNNHRKKTINSMKLTNILNNINPKTIEKLIQYLKNTKIINEI